MEEKKVLSEIQESLKSLEAKYAEADCSETIKEMGTQIKEMCEKVSVMENKLEIAEKSTVKVESMEANLNTMTELVEAQDAKLSAFKEDLSKDVPEEEMTKEQLEEAAKKLGLTLVESAKAPENVDGADVDAVDTDAVDEAVEKEEAVKAEALKESKNTDANLIESIKFM